MNELKILLAVLYRTNAGWYIRQNEEMHKVLLQLEYREDVPFELGTELFNKSMAAYFRQHAQNKDSYAWDILHQMWRIKKNLSTFSLENALTSIGNFN